MAAATAVPASLPLLGPCPHLAGCLLHHQLDGDELVFRAWQVARSREVVVRLYTPEPTLRSAARAARAIQHPSLEPVLAVGQAHGWHYLFTAAGTETTANTWLRTRRGRAAVAAAQVAAAIARGLLALHAEGVVHGAVRPGHLVRLDAGGARLLGAGMPAVPANGILSWTAPEVLGDARPTPASDQFGLGATLFALLAGRPAKLPADPGQARQHLEAHGYPDVQDLVPDVPEDLAAVVATCTESDPTQRYGSMAELADELDRFVVRHACQAMTVESDSDQTTCTGLPQPSTPPEAAAHLRTALVLLRQRRRRRRLAVAVVVLGLVALAGTTRLRDSRASHAAPAATRTAEMEATAPTPASRGNPAVITAAPDGPAALGLDAEIPVQLATTPAPGAWVTTARFDLRLELPPLRAPLTAVQVLGGADLTQGADGTWLGACATAAEPSATVVLELQRGSECARRTMSWPVDLTAPGIEFLEPAADLLRAAGPMVCAVRVADANVASVTIQGQSATDHGSGVFAVTLDLAAGTHKIEVRAQDRAGHETRRSTRAEVQRFPGLWPVATSPPCWELRVPRTDGLRLRFIALDPPGKPAFLIGRTEVLRGELAAWVGRAHLPKPGVADRAVDSLPVVYVSRIQALQYVQWLQAHLDHARLGYTVALPREDEWDFAGRGGTRRRFPWGDLKPHKVDAHLGPKLKPDPETRLRAASPEGVLDLVGGVAEWSEDQAPGAPGRFLVLGSSHLAGQSYADLSAQRRLPAGTTDKDLGFRLVLRPR